jgi:fibro-slime domain-containing protein
MKKNTLWLVVAFLALQLPAQTFPPVINMPVTFYDFHADKSNPEFEPDHNGGLYPGMVQDTLDKDRKPVLGPSPFFNYYIAKWFRPWQAGDFTIPTYTNTAGAFGGIKTVNYDTAFKNVVIPMTLPFNYVQGSTGMYQYYNQNFFMLDGQGFGTEPAGSGHNYSFTMELHTDFTYDQGLVFNFEGDDDVWVFINGHLALDIGGIHSTKAGAIDLDTLKGMQIGKKYNFDFFYAERHTVASDIQITTNLFTPPGYLRLYRTPDTSSVNRLKSLDTAIAGQAFPIYAHVFDSLGIWQKDKDNLVTWTMVDTMGNPILSTTTGSSTGFTPTEANGWVTITATFTDPANPGKPIITSIKVFIAPAAGTHIVIEADSLAARSSRNDKPVGNITVNRTVSTTVYAVVRDQYGNFVRFANNASWSMANAGIASATPLSGKQWAARVAEVSFGNTVLTASEGSLIPGTATVACTGPNAAVPVTATLLDVNHNGHLDQIDIVLPDSVALGATLPTVQQLITSMNIVSTDGGKPVTLIASSMTVEGTRTIHVYLTENTGSTLETGWTSASIKLTDVSVTADGRPIYVAQIIDGAAPVIKSVCFAPTPNNDELRVYFSEPVQNLSPPLDPNYLFSLYTENGKYQFTSTSPTVVKYKDWFVYVFPPTTLSGLDSLVETGRPTFYLSLCGDVSIVVGSRIIGNPFTPGKTLVPVTGTVDLRPGTRVEVSILPALKAKLAPGGTIKGSVTIFDAVGNMVVDKSDLAADITNAKLYFIWDGKTKKSSMASAGSYLARVVIEDLENGKKQNFRMNIGLKH